MATGVTLTEFFASLQTAGQAGVTRNPLVDDDQAQGQAVLAQAFREMCDDLPDAPGTPLQLHLASATRGVAYVYRLCQALVDRTMTGDQVTALCASRPDPATTPAEALSLDLALRHLPELHAMALSMNAGDPLVEGLEAAARCFPLSGVGIRLGQPPDLTLLRQDAVLWRLYVDRIIERQDNTRLDDSETRLAVTDALGEHAFALAPKLAAGLGIARGLPTSDTPDS